MLEVGKLINKKQKDKWLRSQCREYIAGWCDSQAGVDPQTPRVTDKNKYTEYLHGFMDEAYNEAKVSVVAVFGGRNAQ